MDDARPRHDEVPAPPPSPGPRRDAERSPRREPALVIGTAAALALLFLLVVGGYWIRQARRAPALAERTYTLGQIGKAAASAHARDGRLCPSATHPVPPDLDAVRAKLFTSSATDWATDAERHAGFACLGFKIDGPQRYQYDYQATTTAFVATARGDLDGDGRRTSTVRLHGRVVDGGVVMAPALEAEAPDE